MRYMSYVVLVILAAIVGFSAYAQQSTQSRLSLGDVSPKLVAQTPVTPNPPVTTQVEPTPALSGQSTMPAATIPDASPSAAPAAPASTAVDETALRYFARQGDTVRVQAEIDRLRSLHPGWEPPTNLLSDEYVPDADIVRIWDLFTAGDFAGARAAIATKQQADPSFVPSADLLASLDLGEAALRLRNASDAKQYETVISVAANNPDLLVCESVDNLWRLAEAFVRTNSIARANDAYGYVLTNCADTDIRYATLQKAIELYDRADLEPLLAMERTGADGVGEFAALRLDLARRAIAASLEDGGAKPLPADLALLEKAAQDEEAPEDIRLMGWSELARGRADEGRSWFERAMALDPSAESAQGLGVALINLSDPEEAEAALADYRDENDDIQALYLDAAAGLLALTPRVDLESAVLGRIVDTVTATRAALPAQELGWYAYDFQQPQTAVEWFTLALRWQADLESAAYGLMVASNALGDLTTVETIRTQWGPRSPRIAGFGVTNQSTAPPIPQPRPPHLATARPVPVIQQVQPVVQQAAAASQTSSGGRSCTSYVPAASLSAGAALDHAWCLMDLNRPAQAVDHFSRALQSGSESIRSVGAYGLSLAYIRLGLADEAAVAAAAAPISDAQAVELEIAILTKKATSAYDIGDYRRALDALDARARYAPERNDLLTLRAWSYYHIRRYAESARIFEAVAATGYGDAVGGLQAAEAALRASVQSAQ